ncbi:hypothetical protein MHU86_10261 [Fragilaria crotonensis]|nr:hypothetical protein MHU86_10261 [Fragilaria crotonensis]
MYIDELISGTNIPLLNVRPDKLLLLRSMKHTLNRATNMVVQHLNEQQRSQFLPRRTPRAFSDIDDALHDDPPDCPMETRCAVAIIYALRLLYITHHRNYFNRDHGLAEHYFYPDHLFAIAKEIKSTAAALSLLPDTTTFNLLPRFVHDAFDEVDDLFPGTSLGHRSDQYYRDKLPYLQTEFELVQPYVTDYINSFPTPSTEAKEIASDRACELINVALFQHAIIHRMSKKRPSNLNSTTTKFSLATSPADMFLSSFATCYPMITKPSDVQLTFDNVTEDTLAINHTAKPIHPDQVNDPDWIPRHTADLRRHPDADLYHVACDPKRIPFSLAVRLIPVYTTGPSGQTIYQAWALPHLNDALRDPELQLFNNFLSYYHTAKENHPEFPFIDLMGSDSPVPNYDHDSEQEPKHIQHTSPDALTSSTRTDFTYPPIEDLTKTLLKYAKNANLRKLSYPTDLQARRRHFNTFIDNLRIVCNISPWTRQVFDLWPKQVSYSHPFVGTAIYNLIFTNVCDPCQKHIIDGPPDARTAILTLRRHCAPLTPDHVERTREAFCSIKQPHHEVATSYLNRIRLLTRDCYHAGIPNTDAELIKRTVRGGSNHSFYAASYQRFDADIRRAELNDEALPPFAELESHLLNIDESRGLTLPSQNHRNYNQHANAARDNNKLSAPSFDLIPIPAATIKTETNHRDYRKTIRARSDLLQILRDHHSTTRINVVHHHPPAAIQPASTKQSTTFPTDVQSNQRPSPNGSNNNHSRNPSNAATIVCNNCGRLGHYARNCTNPRSNQNNRSTNPQRPSNNENAAPATNNAPTSSLTLAKTHQTNQDTTTKPFQPHLLTTLMVTHPTSLGPILTYLR